MLDPNGRVTTWNLGAQRNCADGARLQQVVWNLLTNALKFTPKGGQVQVLLQRVNSHLELSVKDQGAKVAGFSSAQDGLAALKTTKPTVLVCDVGMPTMDGYELIRTLRAEETRSERIPAVVLTAFARAQDRKRSLAAGYQAHLAKPFDVGELVLIIADLVGR